MISSMTGFAVAAREFEYGAVNVELKSVNHRYLEIQFRLPEELRALESMLREVITGQLGRGKLDCRVAFAPKLALKGASLNQDLLRQLALYSEQVKRALPEVQPMNVANVLNYPGILGDEAWPLETLAADVRALLEAALRELGLTRTREGEKLATFLLERVARMEALTREVAPKVPALVAAYQERLATRVKEAAGNLDDDRLRQEVVLFAAKIDVEEELSRLLAHLGEIRGVLQRGGHVGKRLDFLMQELNREANTLASKSASAEVTKTSVELKVLIEQMREQVQNIE